MSGGEWRGGGGHAPDSHEEADAPSGAVIWLMIAPLPLLLLMVGGLCCWYWARGG